MKHLYWLAHQLIPGYILLTFLAILGQIYDFNFNTTTDAALVGGGGVPQPGEISLAHNGVLFLDELPEFKRSALEVMRQPMEERKVCISRAKMSIDFPASFMLIASMNPCGCVANRGYLGNRLGYRQI